MPFTFLAHQAPVLPLKIWRPRWFSGAGLAIGSMAPDFEKFVEGGDNGRFAHTLLGQFVYCLPLSVAVYWLLTRVVAAPLARYAPDLRTLRMRDYAASLASGRHAPWAVFAASALVGSVSHVILDGFTHADRRVVALFPWLGFRLVLVGDRVVALTTLLQIGASVVGALLALALMYVIGRRRLALAWAGLPPRPVVPPAGPGAARYWGVTIGTTLALNLAFAAAALGARDGAPMRGLALYLAYRLPLTGFAGLCLASAVERWRERRPLDLGGRVPRSQPKRRSPDRPRHHSRSH